MISDLIKLKLQYKDAVDPDTQEPIDVGLLHAIIQDTGVQDKEKADMLRDTISMITGEVKQ